MHLITSKLSTPKWRRPLRISSRYALKITAILSTLVSNSMKPKLWIVFTEDSKCTTRLWHCYNHCHRNLDWEWIPTLSLRQNHECSEHLERLRIKDYHELRSVTMLTLKRQRTSYLEAHFLRKLILTCVKCKKPSTKCMDYAIVSHYQT